MGSAALSSQMPLFLAYILFLVLEYCRATEKDHCRKNCSPFGRRSCAVAGRCAQHVVLGLAYITLSFAKFVNALVRKVLVPLASPLAFRLFFLAGQVLRSALVSLLLSARIMAICLVLLEARFMVYILTLERPSLSLETISADDNFCEVERMLAAEASSARPSEKELLSTDPPTNNFETTPSDDDFSVIETERTLPEVDRDDSPSLKGYSDYPDHSIPHVSMSPVISTSFALGFAVRMTRSVSKPPPCFALGTFDSRSLICDRSLDSSKQRTRDVPLQNISFNVESDDSLGSEFRLPSFRDVGATLPNDIPSTHTPYDAIPSDVNVNGPAGLPAKSPGMNIDAISFVPKSSRRTKANDEDKENNKSSFVNDAAILSSKDAAGPPVLTKKKLSRRQRRKLAAATSLGQKSKN